MTNHPNRSTLAQAVRRAAKGGTFVRVRSTVDGDVGNALRVSSAQDWSRGYIEVDFAGQRVWVRPSDLRIED